MGSKVLTMDDLYENRVPDSKDKYVGIEIEFVSSYDQDCLADKILNSPLSDYVTLKADSSIDDGERLACKCHCEECHNCSGCGVDPNYIIGHELCVLCKESEINKVMAMVNDFLKQVKANVNKSCGLHVHLDMRTRDVKKAYKNLFKSQDLLLNICAPERRSNSFCRPNKEPNFEVALRTDERYRVINARAFGVHKTLEVRLHQGTVKTSEIVKWCKLLCDIADKGGAKLSKPNDLKKIKVNKTIMTYAQSKYRKYTRRAA